jgi:hypothetical protein
MFYFERCDKITESLAKKQTNLHGLPLKTLSWGRTEKADMLTHIGFHVGDCMFPPSGEMGETGGNIIQQQPRRGSQRKLPCEG